MYVCSAAIWKKSTNRLAANSASWPLLGMFLHVAGSGGYVTSPGVGRLSSGVVAPSGSWAARTTSVFSWYGFSDDDRVGIAGLDGVPGLGDTTGPGVRPLPASRVRGVVGPLLGPSCCGIWRSK